MFYIAETIPSCFKTDGGLVLPRIGESILEMVKKARSSIDIASIYSTLINHSSHPTVDDRLGAQIYHELVSAAKRGIKIRLLLTEPSERFPQTEAFELRRLYPDAITVGFLDIPKVTDHDGIQHMKCVIVDKESFFLGSANMDWRAYSEVAEIGMVGIGTKSCARCMLYLFNKFWSAVGETTRSDTYVDVTSSTSRDLDFDSCDSSHELPLSFSVSPPDFKFSGIRGDLEAIESVIKQQNKGILRICSMDYSSYYYKDGKPKFWGELDFLLRKATMKRDVTVQILVDNKVRKKSLSKKSLKTLHQYHNIFVKTISFPKLDPEVPYTCILHAKMCIGEKHAWISTNNISPGYFMGSAGIGCTIGGTTEEGKKMITELERVFDRYYHSEFSENLK